VTALHPGRPGLDHPPSAGRVGRRRALPTGRAVAGGFFVAVAVVVVFAAWLAGTGHSGRAWVVATRNLPAGARLQAGDIGTATMTLPASGAARLAFPDPSQAVGRVLAAPLQAGELLQAGDLLPAGTARPALRPVTVAVQPTDLTGLDVGAPVDVLVTDGSDPSSPTSVVAAGARVLAVGRPSAGLVAGSAGGQLTLGVSSLAQVTAIVHAAHTGTLSVVVGGTGDTATPGAGMSAGASAAGGSTAGSGG
jgi:Flp pilus assembly protein CpaB